MWLTTTFGFFSIVQKPADRAAGTLTVRGRVRADLEALRARYLPDLGPIRTTTHTDYRYRAVAPAGAVGAAVGRAVAPAGAVGAAVGRAVAPAGAVGAAVGRAVADIGYVNFKDAVKAQQGSARAALLHEVWHTMAKLTEPSPPAATAFGGVVVDPAGRVLLRKVAGGFDGYAWTFPKGRPARGESPHATARREVREEAGVDATVVADLPGTYPGGTSVTAYALMRLVRQHGDFDRTETEQVIWADAAEARELIVQTRNAVGRRRDLDVLAAAMAMRG